MARETRRVKFRRGLSELYLPYYDKLCELLPECWQPMVGFRTFQQQKELFAKGRTEPGPIVTRAQPGLSMHNYGLASDWWLFTDEQGSRMANLDYGSPQWLAYVNACEKAGLKPVSYERPHNELMLPQGLCIDMIYGEYQNKGQKGVEALIVKYRDNPKRGKKL